MLSATNELDEQAYLWIVEMDDGAVILDNVHLLDAWYRIDR